MTINQGKYHNTNLHMVDLNVFSRGFPYCRIASKVLTTDRTSSIYAIICGWVKKTGLYMLSLDFDLIRQKHIQQTCLAGQ